MVATGLWSTPHSGKGTRRCLSVSLSVATSTHDLHSLEGTAVSHDATSLAGGRPTGACCLDPRGSILLLTNQIIR